MVSFSHDTSQGLQPLRPEIEQPIVLSIDEVSKKFCRSLKRSLLYGVQDITSEIVGLRQSQNSLREREFWAIKDVSFQLRRGEALGLVGKNGSGKSTLLRIIAGLIKPDAGSVTVRGRVAPLIALGAGFSPVLTGRENIYANMSILGLAKQDIDERFDQVVEFAEINEAIDSPVQTYSSGMAARLGFASAIFTDPDILLIDEVLAVGDAKFQAKCSNQLAAMRKKGTTFILVSHNAMAVKAMCDSAIYLSDGQIQAMGAVDSIIRQYERDLFESTIQSSDTGEIFVPEKKSRDSLGADITYVNFKDKDGKIIKSPPTGTYITLCVGCKVWQKSKHFSLGIAINDLASNGQISLVLESHYDGASLHLEEGGNEIQVEISQLGLRPGVYDMEIYLKKENPHANLDILESFTFTIQDMPQNSPFIGKSLFYQPRSWSASQSSK